MTGPMYVPPLGPLPGDDEPDDDSGCPLGCEHTLWTLCCGMPYCDWHFVKSPCDCRDDGDAA